MRRLAAFLLFALVAHNAAFGQADILLPDVRPAAALAAASTRMDIPASALHAVSLNAETLFAMPLGTEARFTLPGNRGSYPVVFDRLESDPSGNTTWVGHVAPLGRDYRVIVTGGPGGAFGRILLPEGEFRLQTHSGNQWLHDVEASGMRPFATSESDELAPPVAPTGPDIAAAGAEATPTPQTTIDVMVVYTAGMVTRLGSAAAVETRIANLIAIANQSYIDSEVAITLQRVHSAQVAYSDSNTQSVALDHLTYGSDPALAGVAALRNTYGADLVVLLRPFVQAMNNCGLAWIGGYNNSAISGYAAYGFSATLDGSDGPYFCSDYTFTHELGHNMGSVHDRVTENLPTGPSQGAYAYSFGYGVNGSFATVMAYPSSFSNAPRIGRFSNPDLSTCAGTFCGISQLSSNSANNALSLNNTRLGVAAFRATAAGTLPTPPSTVIASAGNATVSVAFAGETLGSGSLIRYEADCLGTLQNGTTSPIVVSGAVNGSLYTCRVRTVTTAGASAWSANSNAVVPTGPVPPTPPSALIAFPYSKLVAVNFSGWTFGSGDFLYFEVDCAGVAQRTGLPFIAIGGLHNGSSYSCRVRTVTTAGASTWSAYSNVVVPQLFFPDAPGTPSVVAGNGAIDVSFSWPASSGSGADLGYEVDCLGARGSSDPSNNGATLRGLFNGSLYTCKARTITTTGVSPWSGSSGGVVPSAPALTAPTGVGATPGNQAMRVDFIPGGLGGGQLINYEADCLGALGSGRGSPIILTGLYNGSAYTCKVRAVTTAGTSAWSASSAVAVPTAVAGTPPAAPGIGTAVSDDRSITFPITPGAAGSGVLLGYEADCLGGKGSGNASPMTVGGLYNGSLYACKVRTVTTVGTSAWSADSNAVVPSLAPLAAPVVTGVVVGNQTLRVDIIPGTLGGGRLLNHEANCAGATQLASTPTIFLTGLYNGSGYTCQVRTHTSLGTSAWSAPSALVVPTPPQAPTPPGSVSITPANGAVNVSYTLGTSLSGYLRGEEVDCLGTRWWNYPGVPLPVTVKGLVNGSAYNCKVRMLDTIDASPWSPSSNTVVPAP